MSELRVRDVTLYYEERGAGTPILCIHGTGGSTGGWGGTLDKLAARGRTIAYDRRGHGRSERPEPYELTSVEEHADDAAGLLRGLQMTHALVIGRGYGAEIALDLVERYPGLVRALILLEPAILTLTAEAHSWEGALVDGVLLAAGAGGPAAGAESYYRRVLRDEDWDGLPEELRSTMLGNAPAVLAELKGGPSRPDEGVLAQLHKPVLIVSSADSPPVFRAVDEVLADLIPGAVHEVVLGPAGPALPEVLGFLDGLLDGRDQPGFENA